MSANQLLADLTAAGLNVIQEPGWKTRGWKWRTNGEPEGICQHHTAPPNPYPIKALYGIRIKANMATHEDGTVYMIAYNACNYSTGPGSRKVLTGNVRPSIPPPDNARARGLHDTPLWGGNKYYWNFENSHPGDGSPIPRRQLDAIITATQVVCDHFGITWEQVISHAEHSRRKIDPRWNGNNRTAIEQIRAGVAGGVVLPPIEPPPPSNEDWTKELIMALPHLKKGDGFKAQNPQLKPDVKNGQGLLLANGFKDQNTSSPEDATDGLFGSGTQTATKQFQASKGLAQDGVIGQKTWTTLLGE